MCLENLELPFLISFLLNITLMRSQVLPNLEVRKIQTSNLLYHPKIVQAETMIIHMEKIYSLFRSTRNKYLQYLALMSMLHALWLATPSHNTMLTNHILILWMWGCVIGGLGHALNSRIIILVKRLPCPTISRNELIPCMLYFNILH